MAFRNGDASELLAGIVVVTGGAAQVELTLAVPIDLAALFAEWRQPRVGRRRDRLPARLGRGIGLERQKLAALGRERLGLLVGGTAEVDAAFEIDRFVSVLGNGGIASGDALHAGNIVA